MMVSDFVSEFNLSIFLAFIQCSISATRCYDTKRKNAAFLGLLKFGNFSSCFVHSCCFSPLLQRLHIF